MCGCEKNIRTFENGGSVEIDTIKVRDIKDNSINTFTIDSILERINEDNATDDFNYDKNDWLEGFNETLLDVYSLQDINGNDLNNFNNKNKLFLYDIVDLDGSIVEKDLTEEALIEWANTYEWYDLMDVSDDFPVAKIDNMEDAIKSIQGVENEGDYSVVKKELEESEKLEDGGVIESFRRFTNSDFTKLTDDDFEGIWSGYVWVIKHKDSSKTLGKFNPKKNTLFILGKKDLTNPLVKWLQENSHVSNDEYYKLEKGGKISKNKNWIANALSGGKNKGALRRTAMRKGLLRNEDEKLSMTDLHKLEKVGGKTSKRAYFAETLRKFDNGGLINGRYLDTISNDKKSKILKNIANHYGVSVSDIEEEVKDADAEMLYEYIANDTSLRMDVYNDFKINKFDNGGMINENWGNDGSTPSNNEDYNKLYELFPDNHAEAKAIWNQLSDKQKSGFIYDLEVTDAASEHIAESWLEFINSSSQDDYWENATNWDEMKNGGTLNKKDEVYIEFLNKDKGFKEDKKSFKSYNEAVEWARENFERFDTDMIKYYKNGGEVGGRGWGNFKKGEKISSLKDIKVGELYLDYNIFFNSKNIILITSGDATGLNRDIVYASFVRPNNLKGREETFAIWDFDLEGKIDLYKIEGRKYEFGGNVDLDIYPDEDLRYTNRKIKKSKEVLVRENIYDGEIQEYILKTIIGKEPEYPYQIVGSLKLTKCFLRPYYKI